MDVRYINPFVVSIKQVLSTMAGVEVQVLKPKNKAGHHQPVGVSGVIGFSGNFVCVWLGIPARAIRPIDLLILHREGHKRRKPLKCQ